MENSSLFADDFKFICDVSSVAGKEQMQGDMNAIVKWSNNNKLLINLEVCFVLHRRLFDARHQYTINKAHVAVAFYSTNLGVLQRDTFSHEAHMRNAVLKISRMVSMIKKLFSARNVVFLKKLFMLCVRSTT